jgi:hypothetical protein
LRDAPAVRIAIVAGIFTLALSALAGAQDFTDAVGGASAEDVAAATETATPNRLMGVLPNYGTIERDARVAPISHRSMLAMTAKNTFDPVVFSFVGLTTALGQGGATPYARRYGTAFADNAIGNFMTSAIFPALLDQDPRYYQRGAGGAAHRAVYALSRVAVTRSTDGRRVVNTSEILGNLTAGAIGNLYYSPASRSLGATLTRWGTQVMWDALSNELKEFWPDARQYLHSKRRYRATDSRRGQNAASSAATSSTP